MDNKLVSLSYLGENVRIVMINNEPWWIAKDVCDILGLSDVSKSLERLDDDEKLTRKFFVSGQNRDIYIINESGLYALILRSNKPEAKTFRKWITSVVLPSIRKTGSYTTKSLDIPSYQIEDPVKRALKWVEETRKHQQALSDAQDVIETQQPSVDMVKDFVARDGLYTMQQAGNIFGYGRNNFFDLLRANHIIQNHNTIPYRHFLEMGYFVVKPLVINEIFDGTQTFVTNKGITWLHKLLNKYKLELNYTKTTNHDNGGYYNLDKHNDKRITDKRNICNDDIDMKDFLNEILGNE